MRILGEIPQVIGWRSNKMIDGAPNTGKVQVRLLGAVDVMLDDEPVALSGLRRKALLAALALNAGHAVSSGLLIEVVWSGNSPATVINTLQSHVSYLRRVLNVSGAIVAAAPGYRLELGADGTDVQVAERLIAQAADAAEPEVRASLLQAALKLWRARPLDDIRGHSSLDEHAERLERTHHVALKALTDVRLVLGEHALLIPGLEDLTLEHPFDEDLSGQLMLALYRAGRQADALAVFRRIRDQLAEELGIDPGRSLRELETAILCHDPTIDLSSSVITISPSSDVPTAIAQLPPAVPDIVGRNTEMDSLDGVLRLARVGHECAGAMPIVAISGMAGIGKSTLALRWAHSASGAFPDGQLYVDLCGFDSLSDPLEPADALSRFLNALGVPSERLPGDVGSLVGMYRTLLSGRRLLVVLDNAHNAEQVRPLLPSAPGCMVLVTSRTDLSPLAITNGAFQLRLGCLSTINSRTLLLTRLGDAATKLANDVIERILRLCGGHPLAIAIAAARWMTDPLCTTVPSEADTPDGIRALDILSGGDLLTDLRSLFSGSYRWLSGRDARVFRMFCLSDAAEITEAAAATYAELSVHDGAAALVELSRTNFLQRHDRDRYTIHPLVRAYGAELALTGNDQQHVVG